MTKAKEPPPEKLSPARQAAVELWTRDPWAFLTGVDPDTGVPMVRTRDEHDDEVPIKAFPSHLEYLRLMVDVIHNERIVFITKPRQMICSTLVLLYAYWDCLFHDVRGWWLSKSTEDEAMDLIDDKIRFVHSQTPQWFQDWAGVKPKPKRMIPFTRTRSQLKAVGQNVASAEARGGTSSGSIVDEAEFQEEFGNLLAAALPQSKKTIVLSTVNPGTKGGEVFEGYLELEGDDHPELGRVYPEIAGFKVKRTSRGIPVVELDYWADPSKDEAWAEKQRPLYPSAGKWRREMMRDRTTSAGDPFYPEFLFKTHVRKAPSFLPDLPVDVGWDFGWRRPAAIWSQYSPPDDRLWVLRELCPQGVDTYSFCALVLYLSGVEPLESLEKYPRALDILELLKRSKGYPPTPWFAPGTRIRHFGGPEANKVCATAPAERVERTDAQVLQSMGVVLSMPSVTIEARENVIRRLLPNRADGYPGLLVDPACPVLVRGMTGGIGFSRKDPRKPHKDGTFENPHDALGYTATQVVPLQVRPSGEAARQIAVVHQSLASKETAAWDRRGAA